MTHFIVLAEAASGEWLQLQRLPHKELKTKGSVKEAGGVQLKPVEPTPGTLLRGRELKEGVELKLEDGKPFIIVKIQRVEIERTRLNVFQQTKAEKEYDWLTQNCQHLVYDFCEHFLCGDRDRHDRFDFELWARTLQDKYRDFAATPPQIDRQADNQMNRVEAAMPTFCGQSESHLLPAAV